MSQWNIICKNKYIVFYINLNKLNNESTFKYIGKCATKIISKTWGNK